MKKIVEKVREIAHRHQSIVGYFLIGVGVVIGGWGVYTVAQYTFLPTHRGVTDNVSVVDAPFSLERSLPTHIEIPSVAIDASFEEPLGVRQDGSIEVPKAFNTVGWYKYGPTPGEIGPAVVIGHVDSYVGPEVFFHLRELELGARIAIDREDGSVAMFEVTELMDVPQGEFPTEEVYGDINYAGLRLITCSGVYNHGTLRYSHNLIVFARLIEN